MKWQLWEFNALQLVLEPSGLGSCYKKCPSRQLEAGLKPFKFVDPAVAVSSIRLDSSINVLTSYEFPTLYFCEPHLFITSFYIMRVHGIRIDLFQEKLSSEVKNFSWELTHFLWKFENHFYAVKQQHPFLACIAEHCRDDGRTLTLLPTWILHNLNWIYVLNL